MESASQHQPARRPLTSDRSRQACDRWHERAPWQLGLGVALVLVLRLPFLSIMPSLDEGGMTYVAARWQGAGSSLYGDMWLDRPPLLLALLKLGVGAAHAWGLPELAGVRIMGTAASLLLVASCWHVSRRIAGPRAGMPAALAAASLSGAAMLGSVATPGELLAAPLGAAGVSIGIGTLTRRQPARRFLDLAPLLLAGALASLALLVKQSFIDALGALVVATLVAGVSTRGATRRQRILLGCSMPAVVAVGAVAAAATILFAAGLAGAGSHELAQAMFTFRARALEVIGESPLTGVGQRLLRLAGVFILSGMAPLLGAGTAALWRSRPNLAPGALALLLSWTAFAVAGMSLGGGFWLHYLIQLVPVAAILGGCAVALPPPTPRWPAARAAVAWPVIMSMLMLLPSLLYLTRDDHYGSERAAASFIDRSSLPGDTIVVMYARANVLQQSGLATPYPYAWSLIVRARPDAVPSLRALLASSDRPTWIVRWQRPDTWGLDPGGRTAALLAHRYRMVGSFCDHPVLLRRDARRSLAAPVDPCA